MRRVMASIFMTEPSAWYIHGIKSNVGWAGLDCPKYGYKFRTSERPHPDLNDANDGSGARG